LPSEKTCFIVERRGSVPFPYQFYLLEEGNTLRGRKRGGHPPNRGIRKALSREKKGPDGGEEGTSKARGASNFEYFVQEETGKRKKVAAYQAFESGKPPKPRRFGGEAYTGGKSTSKKEKKKLRRKSRYLYGEPPTR